MGDQLGDGCDIQAEDAGDLDKGRVWKWRGADGFWTDLGSRVNWTCWTVWEAANIQESRIAAGDTKLALYCVFGSS